MAALLDDLKDITDPLKRAQLAHEAFLATERQAAALRDVRDLAFNELRHTQRMSVRAIAAKLSLAGYPISKTRIADITG